MVAAFARRLVQSLLDLAQRSLKLGALGVKGGDDVGLGHVDRVGYLLLGRYVPVVAVAT